MNSTAPALKLELGRTYLSRSFEEVTITAYVPGNTTYPFQGTSVWGDLRHYTPRGEWLVGSTRNHDLVSEKAGPATALSRSALIKAWADGAVIECRDASFPDVWEACGAPGEWNAPSWRDLDVYRVKPKRWSHLFELDFSVVSTSEDPDNVTASELREGLVARLRALDLDSELRAAASYGGDTWPC
jgi:hypothetical protein